MSYSKGITWIDDCRIPFANPADADYTLSAIYTKDIDLKQAEDWGTKKMGNVSKEQGRFPANILVCDDMLNDGKLSTSEGGKTKRNTAHFGAGTFNMEGYGDKGTNSRYYDIDKWFDKILND